MCMYLAYLFHNCDLIKSLTVHLFPEKYIPHV